MLHAAVEASDMQSKGITPIPANSVANPQVYPMNYYYGYNEYCNGFYAHPSDQGQFPYEQRPQNIE